MKIQAEKTPLANRTRISAENDNSFPQQVIEAHHSKLIPFFSSDEQEKARRESRAEKKLVPPFIPSIPGFHGVPPPPGKPPVMIAESSRTFHDPLGTKKVAPGIDDYFYCPSGWPGPTKSMRDFLSDTEIDSSYKSEISEKYPFLKLK